MPLPHDRESLLRLAAETEDELRRTASVDDPTAAQEHADQLSKLGEIRVRLGESREAERLLDESADAYLMLGSQEGRNGAAAARLRQAAAAAADGRTREALGIIERMIDQLGGVPTFAGIPDVPGGPGQGTAAVVGLWLVLIEEVENYDRLYEAAGIAIPLLDPDGSTTERVVLGKAFVWRARAAEELGYTAEAVEFYEKGIAQLRGEASADTDGFLDASMLTVAALLSQLDRTEEASAAYERVATELKGDKKLLVRAGVLVSRVMVRALGRREAEVTASRDKPAP